MRTIIFSFLLLLLTSCRVTNVIHDYDEQQDFLMYKTYAFFPEMNTGLSDLDQKRLVAVTETAMQNKGFTKSNTPDMYINFKTILQKEPSRNTIGVGVGSSGGGVNVGLGGAIPFGGPLTYLELTLDFVDTKRDELVWQAIAVKRFYPNASPSVRKSFFQKIIEKSLTKYPPKKKK